MAKHTIVDWKRYHALLDIGTQRSYTSAEQKEHDSYLPILAKLDAEESERCKPSTDRLMRKHQENLASLDKLIDGLKKFINR